MNNVIYLIIGFVGLAICTIVLIKDIGADKKKDREESLNNHPDWWDEYQDVCCDEKGHPLCGHCMTDTCMYHANYQ